MEIGEKKEEKFDIDNALDKKGFAEFLIQSGIEDVGKESEENIKKRFEIFVAKEGIKKETREFYKTKIDEKLGLELSNEDLKCVDIFIDRTSISNPDYVFQLSDEIKKSKELPKEIEELSKGVESKIKKIENLQVDLQKLDNLKRAGGVFKRMYLGTSSIFKKENKEILKSARNSQTIWEKYAKDMKSLDIDKSELSETIETEKDNLAWMLESEKSEMGDKINQLNQLTESLFQDSLMARHITNKIKEKTEEKIRNLFDGQSFDELLKSQKKLAEIRKLNQSNELRAQIMDNKLEITSEEEMNRVIEIKLVEEIGTAIKEMSMGGGAFSKIEKVLNKYSNQSKIGSKEGEEIKEFIVEHLKHLSAMMGDSMEEKTKKLFISRIMLKMGN